MQLQAYIPAAVQDTHGTWFMATRRRGASFSMSMRRVLLRWEGHERAGQPGDFATFLFWGLTMYTVTIP